MKLVRQSGVAAVVATHNLDLAARMDRTLRLADGVLVEEEVAVIQIAARLGRLLHLEQKRNIVDAGYRGYVAPALQSPAPNP